MKKVAFICPYFGILPKHCQLWLNSCAANKNFTWFLLTDDKREFDFPDNVIVKYTTLAELKEEYQKLFDFPISLEGVYKLGDYKPLFGYLHQNLLNGYDAWGHIDVADEINGDLSCFITDELLEKYDKLMYFGHMCIYRNTKEVNKRFMCRSDQDFTYRDVFSSDKFYNFEEISKGSISRIYIHNGWKIGRLDQYIADISGINYAFRLAEWSDDLNTIKYRPKIPLIFTYENGKVFGYSIENNEIIKKEYLYVHFKRRKMNVEIPLDSKEYLIVPDGFKNYPEIIDERVIRANSKNKLFYKVFFQEKKKGLLRRINALINSND